MSDDVQRRSDQAAQEVQDLLGFTDHVQRRAADLSDGAHRSALCPRVTGFSTPPVKIDDAPDFLAAAGELTVHLPVTQIGAKLNQERHAGAVDQRDLRQLDLDLLHSLQVSQRLADAFPEGCRVVDRDSSAQVDARADGVGLDALPGEALQHAGDQTQSLIEDH